MSGYWKIINKSGKTICEKTDGIFWPSLKGEKISEIHLISETTTQVFSGYAAYGFQRSVTSDNDPVAQVILKKSSGEFEIVDEFEHHQDGGSGYPRDLLIAGI